MSAADTALPVNTRPMSEPERIMGVFTAPSRTFADIRRSSMWAVAWLLIAVFSVIFVYIVGQKVGWEQVMQNNMRMAPASQQAQMEQIPADRKEAAMRQQVKVTQYMSYGFPILSLIWLVIVALVLWATFSFGAGGDIKFNQSLAILVYASLPGILKSILGMISLYVMQDTENFMIQNPVGTNLGYYLDMNDTPRFLYAMASAVDLITIWVLVLTAIGYSVVGKIKQGTAYTIVFGWYIFVSLVSAGMAAAFA